MLVTEVHQEIEKSFNFLEELGYRAKPFHFAHEFGVKYVSRKLK